MTIKSRLHWDFKWKPNLPVFFEIFFFLQGRRPKMFHGHNVESWIKIWLGQKTENITLFVHVHQKLYSALYDQENIEFKMTKLHNFINSLMHLETLLMFFLVSHFPSHFLPFLTLRPPSLWPNLISLLWRQKHPKKLLGCIIHGNEHEAKNEQTNKKWMMLNTERRFTLKNKNRSS